MTTVATLSVDITADISGFNSGVNTVSDKVNSLGSTLSAKLSNAGRALTTLGTSVTALGAPFAGLAAIATNSFAQSQATLAQLDAVLKSTEASMTSSEATAGHWATVTKASGENVQEWKSQLESAQSSLDRLQAKQAAGLPLSDSEAKRMQTLQDQITHYTTALNNSTTTSKVWVAGQAAVNSISHLTRQAYIDLATSLQKITPFSDETILSAENMLLTFTKIGKDVFPDATRTVLDMSQALGQDVQNSAIQLGKALNDPINGVTALRRVGVALTEAQEKQIKAFMRSGDIMSAQKIILAELQSEFGGSAEAAGKTFAGSLEILRNRADDALEVLGGEMAPALTNITDLLGKGLDVFESLSPSMKTMIANVVLLGSTLAVVGPVIAAIGLGLTALAPVVSALGVAFSVAASPIGLAVAALGGLAILASQVIDFSALGNSIKTELIGALNDLKELTGFDAVGLANSITSEISKALFGAPPVTFQTPPVRQDLSHGLHMTDEEIAQLAGFPNLSDQSLFTPLGKRLADSISTAITTAIGSLALPSLDLSGVQTAITTSFTGMDFSNVQPIMETHFQDILSAIVSVAGIVFGGPVGILIGAARLVGLAIENDFLGIGTFLESSGIKKSVEDAFGQLKSDVDTIISQVFGGGQQKNDVGSQLAATFGRGADGAGDGSPLQVFISDLQTGFEGLKKIITDVWDNISPGLTKFSEGVTGFIQAFADTDTDGLLRVITAIGGVVGAIAGAALELGSEVIGGLLEALGSALPMLGEAISDLISGISQIGSGDFGEAASTLGTVVTDIVNALLDFAGIDITLPDFSAALEGWRTGLEGIKAIVDEVARQIQDAVTTFTTGVRNLIAGAIAAIVQIQIAGTDVQIALGINVESNMAFKKELEAKLADLAQGNLSMPGAATGANVVQTGAVLVHRGERILNPSETKAYEGGGSGQGGGNTLVVNSAMSFDEIVSEARRRGYGWAAT